MIEQLTIENFKSLEKAELSFKRITVIIGPNGSGKSSVIQTLLLLKQSLGQSLTPSGNLLQLGTYEDIIFARDTSRRLSISITGTRDYPMSLAPVSTKSVKFTYRVVSDASGPVRNVMELRGGFPPIQVEWNRSIGGQESQVELDGMTFNYMSNGAVGMAAAFRSAHNRQARSPDEFDEASRSFQQVLATIQDTLQDVYLVPASRALDRSSFGLLGKPMKDLASSGGTSTQAGYVASNLNYKRYLEQKVSALMDRVTGVHVKSGLVEGPQASVEASRGELTYNVVNEGFGSNQLVFLLLQLVDAPQGALVAIEEPEIHLHPRGQTALATVLAEVAGLENKQLIMTTHSEHFLYGLLTMVAEGKLNQNDLQLYFFDRVDASTTVKELPVDAAGRVQGGLPGFFDADVENFQRYVSALAAKLDKPS